MQRSITLTVPQWLAFIVMGAAIAVYLGGSSNAQTPEKAARTEWDYRSVNVPLSTLQAELVRLGQDGWEVIEILHVDQSVTNAGDGTAHLIAGNVEVVAKKPMTK
ncbi:hypothetical protein GC163_02685 [bacterium]|nr:hypothetical protein [bacterium]